MKRISTIAIIMTLLLSASVGVSCSTQLSVNENLKQTQKILENYNQATNFEADSMHDATAITQKGDLDKGYAILEVTKHLYAEELKKYYQAWNAITPPKEFAEYHSSVSDYFHKLENNSRMISSCAEELLDGKESDITKLLEALHTREEIARQWNECSRLAVEALLKTSKK